MSSSDFPLIWRGQCGVLLAAFMDFRDLCAAEQAGFDAQSCAAALKQIADDFRAVVVPWHPKQKAVMASLVGKAWLSAFAKLRKATAGVPVSWSPYITSTSDSTISVLPMPSHLPFAETKLTADTDVFPSSGKECIAHPQCNVPSYATVPLAMGTKKGTSSTAEVCFSSEVGPMSGCLLGVEMVGVDKYQGRTMIVSFEVTSGRVFMEYASYGTMVASVMPALSWDERVLVTVVNAGCVIDPLGGLTFFRRSVSDGREKVHTSGFLCSCSFPQWIAEFHVSVNFDARRLQAPTQVSVLWVGPKLPRDHPFRNVEVSECDSIWSLNETIV